MPASLFGRGATHVLLCCASLSGCDAFLVRTCVPAPPYSLPLSTSPVQVLHEASGTPACPPTSPKKAGAASGKPTAAAVAGTQPRAAAEE